MIRKVRRPSNRRRKTSSSPVHRRRSSSNNGCNTFRTIWSINISRATSRWNVSCFPKRNQINDAKRPRRYRRATRRIQRQIDVNRKYRHWCHWCTNASRWLRPHWLVHVCNPLTKRSGKSCGPRNKRSNPSLRNWTHRVRRTIPIQRQRKPSKVLLNFWQIGRNPKTNSIGNTKSYSIVINKISPVLSFSLPLLLLRPLMSLSWVACSSLVCRYLYTYMCHLHRAQETRHRRDVPFLIFHFKISLNCKCPHVHLLVYIFLVCSPVCFPLVFFLSIIQRLITKKRSSVKFGLSTAGDLVIMSSRSFRSSREAACPALLLAMPTSVRRVPVASKSFKPSTLPFNRVSSSMIWHSSSRNWSPS